MNPPKNISKEKLIAVLPGSRPDEVKRILPIMLQAKEIFQKIHPDYKFIAKPAKYIPKELFRNIEIYEGNTYKLLQRSTITLTSSGTTTLEAILCHSIPIIVHKLSNLSYFAARFAVKMKFIGLPNLILGKYIFPELLQRRAQPDIVAKTILSVLKKYKYYINYVNITKSQLGKPGSISRIAQLICKFIEK